MQWTFLHKVVREEKYPNQPSWPIRKTTNSHQIFWQEPMPSWHWIWRPSSIEGCEDSRSSDGCFHRQRLPEVSKKFENKTICFRKSKFNQPIVSKTISSLAKHLPAFAGWLDARFCVFLGFESMFWGWILFVVLTSPPWPPSPPLPFDLRGVGVLNYIF